MHTHRQFFIGTVVFASMVIGASLPAGAASVTIGPKPVLNLRVEASQTIIIVRQRPAWRQDRRAYRQWLRYQAWRQRRAWYAQQAMQAEEPEYMVPWRQIIVRPRKKTATKPVISSRPKTAEARTLLPAEKVKPRERSTKLAKAELPEEDVTMKRSVISPQKPEEKPDVTKPAERTTKTKPAAVKPKLLSCDAAADIIAGYAFANVKPVNCSGTTYEFRAMRESNAYSVTMNAKDGNLLKVTKRPSSQVVPD